MPMTVRLDVTDPSLQSYAGRRISVESGLTIGRGMENDLVLPDPSRALSKNHCAIEFDHGGYIVVDRSTNGVFLNRSAERLPRDVPMPLSPGDFLQMGDFGITIETITAPGPATPSYLDPAPTGVGADPFDDLLGPGDQQPYHQPDLGSLPEDPMDFGFGAPAANPGFGNRNPPDNSLFGFGAPTGGRAESDALFPAGASPSGMLPDDEDIFGKPLQRDDWKGPSMADDAASPSVAFIPPRITTEAIPDDWDPMADLGLSPPPPPARPPQAAAHQPQRPPAQQLPDDIFSTPPAPQRPEIPDDIFAPPEPARPVPQVAPYQAPAPQQIPDDIFGEPEPAPPPVQVPPPAPQPIARPPVDVFAEPGDVPPPAPVARPAPVPQAADTAILAAFFKGLGIDGSGVSETQSVALMTTAGRMLRLASGGLMDILAARASTKEEFRIERTMIGAKGNNPLKFSSSVDEAVQSLLLLSVPGFLNGEAAIDEAIRDIKAHELAMLAGLQVALNTLIQRFDPKQLEQRLEKSSLLDGILPGNRKAKYWELFVQLYKDIAGELEDDFQGLFGKEFASAYKDQIDRL